MLQMETSQLFSDKLIPSSEDIEFEYSKTIAPKRNQEASIEFSFVLEKLDQSSIILIDKFKEQFNGIPQCNALKPIYGFQTPNSFNRINCTENMHKKNSQENLQEKKSLINFRIHRNRSLTISNRSCIEKKRNWNRSPSRESTKTSTSCSSKIIRHQNFQYIEEDSKATLQAIKNHHTDRIEIKKVKKNVKGLENIEELKIQKNILFSKKKPLNERKRVFKLRKQLRSKENQLV